MQALQGIKMTIKKIGRLTLFKYCIISVIAFLAIPIFLVLLYDIFSNEHLSISVFLNNLNKDFKVNELFVFIQVLIVLVGIWIFGGIAGQLIIIEKRGKFLIGSVTIFKLWMLLFISSALTGGLLNSSKYGQGFSTALADWFIYGLLLYIFLGAVHGLLIGFFLGREIFNKGQKINAL